MTLPRRSGTDPCAAGCRDRRLACFVAVALVRSATSLRSKQSSGSSTVGPMARMRWGSRTRCSLTPKAATPSRPRPAHSRPPRRGPFSSLLAACAQANSARSKCIPSSECTHRCRSDIRPVVREERRTSRRVPASSTRASRKTPKELELASEPHTAEWRVGRWPRFGYEPRSRRGARAERLGGRGVVATVSLRSRM